MKWLTNEIATGAYEKVINLSLEIRDTILDVRDLVDKSGNNLEYINRKINEGIDILKRKNKIIVCCDYGMSRSNSIALGIMVKFYNFSFFEAVELLKTKVDEEDVKIEMLNSVYSALYPNRRHKQERRNILLTGSSGFLGKTIKDSLGNRHTVHTPNSSIINLLTDVLSLDIYVKKFDIDTIVHLANPKIFTTNKSMGDTIVMLKNVLDICRTNDIKLIFLSGWEIYSAYVSRGLFANESLPANAKGTYGETKWLCEELIKQYSKNYNLKYQIIRSGPVYGPDANKPKFIYNFIDKALRNEDIFTHKYINGFPALDLIYITDFSSFISACVDDYEYQGDINIGSGKSISTNEIAHLVKEKLKSQSRIQYVQIDDYAPNIIMNTDFFYSHFNMHSKITIENGLNLVIEEYKLRILK